MSTIMRRVETLLNEAQAFIEPALKIQNDALSEEVRYEKLNELSKVYHAWYFRVLPLIDHPHLRPQCDELKKQYEGGFIASKIKSFLEGGHKLYSLYNADKPNPFFPKWTYPAERTFVVPLRQQLIILSSAKEYATSYDYDFDPPTVPPPAPPPVKRAGDDERWFSLFERLTVIEEKLDRLMENANERN